MARRLRVYPKPCDPLPEDDRPTVSLRLRDLQPLLAQAQKNNYRWLQDFLDDEVHVTQDLFEVLRAFQCYRPSA